MPNPPRFGAGKKYRCLPKFGANRAVIRPEGIDRKPRLAPAEWLLGGAGIRDIPSNSARVSLDCDPGRL